MGADERSPAEAHADIQSYTYTQSSVITIRALPASVHIIILGIHRRNRDGARPRRAVTVSLV